MGLENERPEPDHKILDFIYYWLETTKRVKFSGFVLRKEIYCYIDLCLRAVFENTFRWPCGHWRSSSADIIA